MRRRIIPVISALFGTWANTAITLVMLTVLGWVIPKLFGWAVSGATWVASSRSGCAAGGACWALVGAKIQVFLFGNYALDQEWRVAVAFILFLLSLAGCVLSVRHKGRWLISLFLLIPVNALLLRGGVLGLKLVPTAEWGGLMLNIVLGSVAIVFAIPIGMVLAFARRSRRKLVAMPAVAFIEFWRAVPLVAVLFVGVVMLPLFLPGDVSFDNLARAIFVLVLFTSAYMAEVFRSALNVIPKGQQEAAAALGMNNWLTATLVLLPQAMRLAVPGIVNVSIDFFKDTSLVSIVGLLDLVGATSQAIKDPNWLGLTSEAYSFAAALFFCCCLLIALSGQLIERRLNRPYFRGKPN